MTKVFSVVRTFFKELRDRRQLMALLQKDDRMLRDVGLTREDIGVALSKPFSIQARNEAMRLSRLSFSLDRKL